MKNIHILPTNKPSRLFNCFGKLGIGDYVATRENVQVTNQNICITNDEEIKEGDYYLSFSKSIIKNITKYGEIGKSKTNMDFSLDYVKKIILTDNKELIKDGVQSIDDDFLEWFVKNPSCERVEVRPFKKWSGNDEVEPIYKIIIPSEEPKLEPCDNCNNDVCCCIIRTQETLKEKLDKIVSKEPSKFWKESDERLKNKETLEEAAERAVNSCFKEQTLFKLGAKWQQEQDRNKYSEEEVLEILYQHTCELFKKEPLTLDEFFNKFKKK